MSAVPDPDALLQMNMFLTMCKISPAILHQPEVGFLKSFIEYFGGTVPEPGSFPKAASREKNESKEPRPEAGTDTDPKIETNDLPSDKPQEPAAEPEAEAKGEPEPEAESEESDLELDTTGVIEPDTDDPQELEDMNVELTEEELAESQTEQFGDDYAKAIRHYTAAIKLNPEASLPYAKRAQYYLLMNKPNACIRDCNRCLELNPDSAAAHKFRGRAKRLLGMWEEAAQDLRLACKFDFDEQADEWLREVTPNARKIEEHKRKRERKMQEKLAREKQEKLKKQSEDKGAQKQSSQSSDFTFSVDDFVKLSNDQGITSAFKDPEVREAFNEIFENPASIMKYRSNPKIMAIVDKVASKYLGGFP